MPRYCAAPAGHCLPLPQGWTTIEAASLPETTFTVWINVFDRGRLAVGETLLVQGGRQRYWSHGDSDGAGAGWHRVFVTAGSPEKCSACEEFGAERAINYRTEDFVEVLNQLTSGKGVDVILDMVAGDYAPRELKCLAEDGRLSIIALLGGDKAEVDFSEMLRRRLTITASTLRPRNVEFKSTVAAALKQRVWPLIEAKKIRPAIFKVFPLADATGAHALMESGAHIGKIVLKVAEV